jgi:hypothetical protein
MEDEFLECQHISKKELCALLDRLGVDVSLFPKMTQDLLGKSTFERFLEAAMVPPESYFLFYQQNGTVSDAIIFLPRGKCLYVEVKTSFMFRSDREGGVQAGQYQFALGKNHLLEGHGFVGFCIRQPYRPSRFLYDEAQEMIQPNSDRKWGPVVFGDDLSKLAGRLVVATHDNAAQLGKAVSVCDPATRTRRIDKKGLCIQEYDGTDPCLIQILASFGLTPNVIDSMRQVPHDTYMRWREAFLQTLDEVKRADFFKIQAEYKYIARQLKGVFLGADLAGKLGCVSKLTALGFPKESVAVDFAPIPSPDCAVASDALAKWKGKLLRIECKSPLTRLTPTGVGSTLGIRAKAHDEQFSAHKNDLVYIVANPESLRRDIGLQVQGAARSLGKPQPPLNLDWLKGGFKHTVHFLIPTSAINTIYALQKCWEKIMLKDNKDWMMDYMLESHNPAQLTRILDIAAQVNEVAPLRSQGLRLPHIDTVDYLERWTTATDRRSPDHIQACRVCLEFCAHVEEQMAEGRTFPLEPRNFYVAYHVARMIRDCIHRCYNDDVEAFVRDGNRPVRHWLLRQGGCRKDGACGHKKDMS